MYAPIVLFYAGVVVLMGTADTKDLEFIATIVAESKIDRQKILNLQAEKLKLAL